MAGTDPLTGARYPTSGDAPQVYQDIKNLANDLSDNTIPSFSTTTARDTAFSAWVTAGNTMRSGLLAEISGGGRWRYNGASWDPDLGLIEFDSATSQWDAATGGAEQRITTLGLSNVQMRSGQLYRARLKCRAWPGTNGVTFSLRIRVSSTGTPTTSSTAVAVRQVALAPGPSTAASDYTVEDYFVVQSNGTFSISAFGIVSSGVMAVGVDGRGRYELQVFNEGAVMKSGMNTVVT